MQRRHLRQDRLVQVRIVKVIKSYQPGQLPRLQSPVSLDNGKQKQNKQPKIAGAKGEQEGQNNGQPGPRAASVSSGVDGY